MNYKFTSFLFVFFIYSCQEQGNQLNFVHDEDSKLLAARLRNIVQQNMQKTYSTPITYLNPDYLNDSVMSCFNGKMSIEDIKKNLITKNLTYGYQVDTFELEDLVIVGMTSEYLAQRNILFSYFAGEQEVLVDQLVKNSKGDLIIPYYSGLDGNNTLWTKWTQEGDSLVYSGFYHKIFYSKFGSTEPREFITRNGKYFVLGHSYFGDGGVEVNEYWLSRVLENDVFSESDNFGTAYYYEDDTIKLPSYEIGSDRVHFYENYYLNKPGHEKKTPLKSKSYIGHIKFK